VEIYRRRLLIKILLMFIVTSLAPVMGMTDVALLAIYPCSMIRQSISQEQILLFMGLKLSKLPATTTSWAAIAKPRMAGPSLDWSRRPLPVALRLSFAWLPAKGSNTSEWSTQTSAIVATQSMQGL
jgi:hypothetical protein